MRYKLLYLESSGSSKDIAADLTVETRFELSSNDALAARLADAPVVLDCTDDSVLLRDLEGHVVAHHAVYPTPRALAVSPDGTRAAAVLDTKLLLYDLSK
jgi:hypothetical protein